MDYGVLNIFRKNDMYCSYISYNNYIKCIESYDLFTCLTDIYGYLKALCDRERLYINKDTLKINLINVIYNEEKDEDEFVMRNNYSYTYKEIYNIVF